MEAFQFPIPHLRRTRWVLAAVFLFGLFAVTQERPKVGVQGLPIGIVNALAGDEKDYCAQWLGSYRKGCRDKFRRNLLWRTLTITPSGKEAFLIENHNMGACGVAGCSLSLFTQQRDEKFVQVLGTQGEVGTLGAVTVLTTITNGYYDLQKTWTDGGTKTVFKWNLERYSPVESQAAVE